jgi:single-stranded DNA-binding protein
MLNVMFSGSMLKDPSIRPSKKGADFATFLVKTSGKEGDLVISCIAFHDHLVAQVGSLKKGDGIAVTGTATLREYEKDGEAKQMLSVVAEQLMSFAVKPGIGNGGSGHGLAPKPAPKTHPAPIPDSFDDNIPF